MIPKTVVVSEFPESFFDWWDEDGVRLPIGMGVGDGGNDDDEDDDGSWDDDGQLVGAEHRADADSSRSETPPVPPADFVAFVADLQNTIDAEFNGQCMCKLAGSAPRDALFLSESGGLAGGNAKELLVMLKGSNHVNWSMERTPRAELRMELREWRHDIQLSHEFRCFVDLGGDADSASDSPPPMLLGVSQRDCSTYFPHLAVPSNRDDVARRLRRFFRSWNCSRQTVGEGAAAPVWRRVAVDVCLSDGNRLWIIDEVPWDTEEQREAVDPLLFSWDELTSPAPPTPALRVVEQHGIRPNLRVFSAAPIEFTDENQMEQMIEQMNLSGIMKNG